MNEQRPVFLPLRAEFFRAFAAGTKTVEWRKFGPRFNERTLWVGKRVTLSNGYSRDRLTGRIVQLEFSLARKVEGALSIYKPSDTLVGIHIKVDGVTPRRKR